MRLCSVEGCGRKHNAKGLCSACGQKKWRRENPDKARAKTRRDTRIRNGIVDATSETREGDCPICGRTGPLVLDHDHLTRLARGWLCGRCNVGIGMLNDSPSHLRAAAAYLESSCSPKTSSR
jgi:5-methylcytosine-specific restriction endonuclease McrA